MICKEVNYELAMHEWANLLDSGDLPDDRDSIARAHLAGLKVEKEMAYYLTHLICLRGRNSQALAIQNGRKLR